MKCVFLEKGEKIERMTGHQTGRGSGLKTLPFARQELTPRFQKV